MSFPTLLIWRYLFWAACFHMDGWMAGWMDRTINHKHVHKLTWNRRQRHASQGNRMADFTPRKGVIPDVTHFSCTATSSVKARVATKEIDKSSATHSAVCVKCNFCHFSYFYVSCGKHGEGKTRWSFFLVNVTLFPPGAREHSQGALLRDVDGNLKERHLILPCLWWML